MGIESKARRRVIASSYCEPEPRGYRCLGPAKNRNLQPFEVYLQRHAIALSKQVNLTQLHGAIIKVD